MFRYVINGVTSFLNSNNAVNIELIQNVISFELIFCENNKNVLICSE